MHLSFDLWTSHNRLALLGVVAHYIDSQLQLKTTLLDIPHHRGRHTGTELASSLLDVIWHYNLQGRLRAFITNNASENIAYLRVLSKHLGINPR